VLFSIDSQDQSRPSEYVLIFKRFFLHDPVHKLPMSSRGAVKTGGTARLRIGNDRHSFFCGCSPSIRHVTHFQLAIEHRYPNLNKTVSPLSVQRICRFFAQRKLTTSLTADSAMLLLMGIPR
jgi:hypothetical protein